ncbi:MAG: hydrogenase [Planctomycetes bacterium]|nr:hydrogenase [Planctomycetota bacterium]
MTTILELLLVFVVLTNVALLGTSRLFFLIRIVSVQGIFLGLLPIFASDHGFDYRLLILSVLSISVKSIVFPWLMFRALREANVQREAKPRVGYSFSILIGVFMLGASFMLASGLRVPHKQMSPLELPIAFATILSGLFLIVTRTTALNQVIGYTLMENGIYLFGVALVIEEPLLVEMGVLLDLMVAILVMGVAMFHINRTFDTMDVDQLSSLTEWRDG